jgi:hypothetical protein
MNRQLFILLIILIPSFSIAQPIDGATGLMKIPTADMQKDGTFILGANYLPDAITKFKDFNYDTGNYFFNVTFLPFLEFTYRSTLMSWDGNHNQDRSFGLRLNFLKEKRFIPSVVLGGNDLYSTSAGIGSSYFNSIYLVATKHLEVSDNQFGFTLGIGNGGVRNQNLNGVFGGVSWVPAILPTMKLMAEYDADVVSTGVDVLIGNHLYIFGMAYDLKYFAGGLAYRFYFRNQEH